MKPDKDAEQIAKEALDWLITLREEPDNRAIRTRFETWRAASPTHAVAWTEARHTWELLGEALPTPPVRQANETRQVNKRRLLSIATTALAACLLLAFLPSIQRYLQADYLSGIGETRQIRLEDGSRVQLGADSALAVDYSLDARRVRLLSGEAFFEVTPDARRPFRVAAGQLETTVVGTAFNVRFTPTGVAVAVHQGTVNLNSSALFPPLDARLTAGDWARMSWAANLVERGVVPPQQVAAWRQGQLIVKDWTIREVVAELRRYHRGLIVLTDDQTAHLKVTGVYNLHDPLGSLRAVAQPYAAVVREVTPYLVFLSAS